MGEERQLTVALVGRRLPHNENLGLGYLRAALRQAGFRVRVHTLNDGNDLDRIARALRDEEPTILGLSLADGGSALLPLALGELMRARGFRGHVTCGGQFATLARAWLLDRYPWLHSVVRFAGEAPLVDIARRLAAGLPVAGVAGVTTREGDGPPAPVLDDLPMQLVPEHDELPEVLGLPACHIAASRGCEGRCHYCSPAALQTGERAEGRAAGATLEMLKEAGVGGVRRRDLKLLCDEMADLYHDRGVRYFYFVDEHLLPYGEPEALAYLEKLRAGLERRRVGPLGIGCMLRADRVTPTIVKAFREVGLVRCFVGLELASLAEGKRFGRPPPSARELALLDAFAGAGVATVSNLMLVHPHSTMESLAGGVDLLSRVGSGVFEATRMMVYHGTRLHDRMEAEGRLVGNPFRYGYLFEDPAVERFAEIFTRLRKEAFWNYSIAYRTHDTHLSLALARRVQPKRVVPAVAQRLERTRRGVNALYIDAYRRGLRLAHEGGGWQEATPLIEHVRRGADALERELDAVEAALLTQRSRRLGAFAPVRAAAAGVITFTMMGAPSAGCDCGSSHTRDRDAAVDAGRRDAGFRDAGGPLDAAACTAADVEAARIRVQEIAAATAPCFSGGVYFDTPDGLPDAQYSPDVFGPSGQYYSVCPGPALDARRAAEERLVEDAMEADGPACAEGFVTVDGGAKEDMTRLAETAAAACGGMFFDGSFQVVLGADGSVIDVRTRFGDPALAACVRDALRGLSFPCLASLEVCPEFAIAE